MAGGHVGRFLHACSSAPVQLIGDTPQKDGPASDDAAEALARALAAGNPLHGHDSDPTRWSRLAADADEVLREEAEWGAEVNRLLDSARSRGPGVVLRFDSPDDLEEHILLRRVGEHEFLLVLAAAGLEVRAYGPTAPRLRFGDRELAVVPLEAGEGWRWRLPPREEWPAQTDLAASIGPDRVRLRLPSSIEGSS